MIDRGTVALDSFFISFGILTILWVISVRHPDPSLLIIGIILIVMGVGNLVFTDEWKNTVEVESIE